MAIGTGIAGILGLGSKNPYGKTSQGQWNLSRGVYTRSDGAEIVFFFETKEGENPNQRTAMDQASESGGRRLAVYEYPYRDGQRVADLGRKGETITLSIKFHGLDYQRKFREFLKVVADSNLGGTLLHPVRGAMTVRFKDYELLHRFDEWNAVTIKAVFIEDNASSFNTLVGELPSVNASLRDGVQILANVQTFLSKAINDANLINIARNTLKQRLESVLAQVSQLFGNLAATFSTDAALQTLLAQGNEDAQGVTSLSSGTTVMGSGVEAQLPPVFQVGFDAETQASVNAQAANYIAANQVTPQQAVFSANSARQAITAAINEAESLMGIQGYQIVLTYRQLAVAIQAATEAAISSQQARIKVYVVPRPMSVRAVAKENGLDYSRQNDIENLNPYLPSVNYLPAGTEVTVPVA